MKHVSILTWTLIVGLSLAVPLSGLSADEQKADEQKGKPLQQIVAGQVERPEAAIATTASQDNKLATTAIMPVYIPPKRGAPAGRLSGGTRGLRSDWQ